MRRRQNDCRGTGLIEFTLIVIPVLFLVVSICEIARGMWIYHTVAYAVQQGARYSIVHGELCGNSSQSCLISVDTLAQVINRNAAGLDPSRFRVTLKSRNGSVSC